MTIARALENGWDLQHIETLAKHGLRGADYPYWLFESADDIDDIKEVATAMEKGQGSLRIRPRGRKDYSIEEREAAQLFSKQGKHVVLRPDRNLHDLPTSDLVVNGETWDIYAPTSSSDSTILGEIAEKNEQAEVVVLDLRHSSITLEKLGDPLARVQGSLQKKGHRVRIKRVIILGR